MEFLILAYIILIFIFWIRFVVAIRLDDPNIEKASATVLGLMGAIYWPVVLVGIVVWKISITIISYMEEE